MANERHIFIDIPEAEIDFTNPAWQTDLKNDFQDIQNAIERNPNPLSPTYQTWFWFFMRYGRALCSAEGQAYLRANNLSPFTLVKNVVGLPMSGGGAYTIGYSFYNDCLSKSKVVRSKGININFRSGYNVSLPNLPLQQIFYGAPGTGKSYGTDNIIHGIYPQGSDDEKKFVFRTTFHPDTDYSLFVGCYKPTKTKTPILNQTQLIAELHRMQKEEANYALDKFGFIYWESFNYDVNKDDILSACGISTQISHLNSGIALGKKFSGNNSGITYDFVPQVFINAYITAWKALFEGATINDTENEPMIKPVFLVIEEINRGNCAQIFGDLFQLLDRKGENSIGAGRSCYPIKPDTDLGNYIAGQLRQYVDKIDDEMKAVALGEEMVLPENLYIWATMNTSDQSLFPIDSAFKRRWDWEYVPIEKGKDRESGVEFDWKIAVNKSKYDWWQFLEAINQVIYSTTHSEDKQLGYFFCKANADGIIDENKFINKVIFYLWNDVFKDYGFKNSIFNDTDIKERENKDEKLTFDKFFKADHTRKVEIFLNNLKLIPSATDYP